MAPAMGGRPAQAEDADLGARLTKALQAALEEMGAKGVVKALAARSEARNELIVVLQLEDRKMCLAALDLTCATAKQDLRSSLKVYKLTYEVDAQYGQSEADSFP